MWHIAVLIVALVTTTSPAQAKPKDTERNPALQRPAAGQSATVRDGAFNPADRNLIRAHLLGRDTPPSPPRGQSLPPGLQKKVARGKALPPGWEKKLAAGQRIDHQIYRQGESLPEGLLHRLSPSPVGTEILQIQGKIVRLNSATRTILDVFDLAPAR